ncbi:hypothetical protein HDU96_009952 [Phlyctochytrium bullatum]|nr:hypothetical protein HDU96_009952 [Phlyctochytrium bullatum]
MVTFNGIVLAMAALTACVNAQRLAPPAGKIWLGAWYQRVEGDTPLGINNRIAGIPGEGLSFFQTDIDIMVKKDPRTALNITEPYLKQLEETGTDAFAYLTIYAHGEGLQIVSDEAIIELAQRLERIMNASRKVFLRMYPEMNGNWFPHGQNPKLFKEKWIAHHDLIVRNISPSNRDNIAFVWAPNSGNGYPFPANNTVFPRPGDPRLAEGLDTNGNGRLDGDDDPYLPYYPGDDYVDWVGISVYHCGFLFEVIAALNADGRRLTTWIDGSRPPWRDNVLPFPNLFEGILQGLEPPRADIQWPKKPFYDEFCIPNPANNITRGNKPFILSEGGAAYHYRWKDEFIAKEQAKGNPLVNNPPDTSVPREDIKQAFWRQYLNLDFLAKYPQIKAIGTFEFIKEEEDTFRDFTIFGTPPMNATDGNERANRTLVKFLEDSKQMSFVQWANKTTLLPSSTSSISTATASTSMILPAGTAKTASVTPVATSGTSQPSSTASPMTSGASTRSARCEAEKKKQRPKSVKQTLWLSDTPQAVGPRGWPSQTSFSCCSCTNILSAASQVVVGRALRFSAAPFSTPLTRACEMLSNAFRFGGSNFASETSDDVRDLTAEEPPLGISNADPGAEAESDTAEPLGLKTGRPGLKDIGNVQQGRPISLLSKPLAAQAAGKQEGAEEAENSVNLAANTSTSSTRSSRRTPNESFKMYLDDNGNLLEDEDETNAEPEAPPATAPPNIKVAFSGTQRQIAPPVPWVKADVGKWTRISSTAEAGSGTAPVDIPNPATAAAAAADRALTASLPEVTLKTSTSSKIPKGIPSVSSTSLHAGFRPPASFGANSAVTSLKSVSAMTPLTKLRNITNAASNVLGTSLDGRPLRGGIAGSGGNEVKVTFEIKNEPAELVGLNEEGEPPIIGASPAAEPPATPMSSRIQPSFTTPTSAYKTPAAALQESTPLPFRTPAAHIDFSTPSPGVVDYDSDPSDDEPEPPTTPKGAKLSAVTPPRFDDMGLSPERNGGLADAAFAFEVEDGFVTMAKPPFEAEKPEEGEWEENVDEEETGIPAAEVEISKQVVEEPAEQLVEEKEPELAELPVDEPLAEEPEKELAEDSFKLEKQQPIMPDESLEEATVADGHPSAPLAEPSSTDVIVVGGASPENPFGVPAAREVVATSPAALPAFAPAFSLPAVSPLAPSVASETDVKASASPTPLQAVKFPTVSPLAPAVEPVAAATLPPVAAAPDVSPIGEAIFSRWPSWGLWGAKKEATPTSANEAGSEEKKARNLTPQQLLREFSKVSPPNPDVAIPEIPELPSFARKLQYDNDQTASSPSGAKSDVKDVPELTDSRRAARPLVPPGAFRAFLDPQGPPVEDIRKVEPLAIEKSPTDVATNVGASNVKLEMKTVTSLLPPMAPITAAATSPSAATVPVPDRKAVTAAITSHIPVPVHKSPSPVKKSHWTIAASPADAGNGLALLSTSAPASKSSQYGGSGGGVMLDEEKPMTRRGSFTGMLPVSSSTIRSPQEKPASSDSSSGPRGTENENASASTRRFDEATPSVKKTLHMSTGHDDDEFVPRAPPVPTPSRAMTMQLKPGMMSLANWSFDAPLKDASGVSSFSSPIHDFASSTRSHVFVKAPLRKVVAGGEEEEKATLGSAGASGSNDSSVMLSGASISGLSMGANEVKDESTSTERAAVGEIGRGSAKKKNINDRANVVEEEEFGGGLEEWSGIQKVAVDLEDAEELVADLGDESIVEGLSRIEEVEMESELPSMVEEKGAPKMNSLFGVPDGGENLFDKSMGEYGVSDDEEANVATAEKCQPMTASDGHLSLTSPLSRGSPAFRQMTSGSAQKGANANASGVAGSSSPSGRSAKGPSRNGSSSLWNSAQRGSGNAGDEEDEEDEERRRRLGSPHKPPTGTTPFLPSMFSSSSLVSAPGGNTPASQLGKGPRLLMVPTPSSVSLLGDNGLEDAFGREEAPKGLSADVATVQQRFDDIAKEVDDAFKRRSNKAGDTSDDDMSWSEGVTEDGLWNLVYGKVKKVLKDVAECVDASQKSTEAAERKIREQVYAAALTVAAMRRERDEAIRDCQQKLARVKLYEGLLTPEKNRLEELVKKLEDAEHYIEQVKKNREKPEEVARSNLRSFFISTAFFIMLSIVLLWAYTRHGKSKSFVSLGGVALDSVIEDVSWPAVTLELLFDVLDFLAELFWNAVMAVAGSSPNAQSFASDLMGQWNVGLRSGEGPPI